MKKFLVVGIGGSGGAAVRYLIDQLRADLRKREIDSLPDAWQFVHIDVNPVPEATPGLGDIRDLGGRYVAISSAGNTFRSVRQTVDARLNTAGRLDSLLGWAPLPRDQADNVPVGTGAGQYRAIGRMLTLTRLDQLQSELQLAWQALQKPAPWGELPIRFADEGPYNNAGGVVPIVIGSMAGGSGASMFLDTCRVLGRVGGIDRRQLGVFLFTPDVFSSLDASKRKGIDGNALGALGELLAAQVRSSDEIDNDLLVALGLPAEPENERAFGRVFPIGSFIGGDGAKFGETSEHIYRGLGRALAATISSNEAAVQYLHTKFENPLAPSDGQELLGWGGDPAEVSWGSFGYSSLSLGRDRYAEYVAQRLARTAVDRLVGGYRNPASQLPPTEQLDQLVANQWPTILERLQFPSVGTKAQEWLRSGPLSEGDQYQVAQKVVDPAWQAIERIEAQNASTWLDLVQQCLPAHQPQAAKDLERASYAWVENFAHDLEQRTAAEILRITSHPSQGLPYARKVLEKLSHDVGGLVEKLRKAPTSGDPLRMDVDVTRRIAKAELDVEVREKVRQSMVTAVQNSYEASAAHRAAGILTSYSEDVLDGLSRAVNHALENLDAAMKSIGTEAGLAQLHTTVYNEWPANSEQVPPRFDHAQNEVLLTTAAEFPARFREHIEASATGATFVTGMDTMVEEIVRGSWDNVGAERSDFTVLRTDVDWRAPDLRTDARTGDPRPQSKPVYRLALATADILERALAYQARKDQAFARFSSETFEGYLNETGISDTLREERRKELVLKFEEAVKQAEPLVGVRAPMVEALHRLPLQIELTFSTVPLTPGSLAAEDVKALLARSQNLEQQTLDRFEQALKVGDTSSRIAIYGSYPRYFPLVFTSFLSQLQDRWSGEAEEGKRELWKWKRTRPLPAAVGMSRKELVAVIKGWYLGRALGLVHHPSSVHSADPVQVFDLASQQWREFDRRGLTARDTYRGAGFDWLPGIIEGHTLAVVNTVNDPSFASLRPYQALRRICDNGVQPTVGPITSGERLVGDWLTSGTWPSGEPSQIAATTASHADASSRAAALKGWLASVRDYVSSTFLTSPTGPGRLAERRTLVQSTQALDGLAMFAEIALVSHVALEELISSVDRALAVPGEGANVAPQV